MAIYARVRLGPITWVERLDDDGPPPTTAPAALRRARARRAPWWAWLLIAGAVLVPTVLFCVLPVAL